MRKRSTLLHPRVLRWEESYQSLERPLVQTGTYNPSMIVWGTDTEPLNLHRGVIDMQFLQKFDITRNLTKAFSNNNDEMEISESFEVSHGGSIKLLESMKFVAKGTCEPLQVIFDLSFANGQSSATISNNERSTTSPQVPNDASPTKLSQYDPEQRRKARNLANQVSKWHESKARTMAGSKASPPRPRRPIPPTPSSEYHCP